MRCEHGMRTSEILLQWVQMYWMVSKVVKCCQMLSIDCILYSQTHRRPHSIVSCNLSMFVWLISTLVLKSVSKRHFRPMETRIKSYGHDFWSFWWNYFLTVNTVTWLLVYFWCNISKHIDQKIYLFLLFLNWNMTAMIIYRMKHTK